MITIDGFPFDLLVSGELALDNEVTKDPVEDGSDTTDNIRKLAGTLNVECIVSDSPIGDIENHETRRVDDVTRAVFGDAVPLPSDQAYAKLLEIRENKKRVTIELPVASRSGKPATRVLQNMAIEHLSFPMNAETNGGLFFSASFVQVRIIINRKIRVAVPASGNGSNKLGLSLDKIVDGDKILWRKGKPPGSSPSTTPAGVITGQEVVSVKRGKFYHENGKLLTTEELQAFTKDVNRDTALMTRRGIARAEQQVFTNGQQIQRAQAMLSAKEVAANPEVAALFKKSGQPVGALTDPAIFGLKPPRP